MTAEKTSEPQVQQEISRLSVLIEENQKLVMTLEERLGPVIRTEDCKETDAAGKLRPVMVPVADVIANGADKLFFSNCRIASVLSRIEI